MVAMKKHARLMLLILAFLCAVLLVLYFFSTRSTTDNVGERAIVTNCIDNPDISREIDEVNNISPSGYLRLQQSVAMIELTGIDNDPACEYIKLNYYLGVGQLESSAVSLSAVQESYEDIPETIREKGVSLDQLEAFLEFSREQENNIESNIYYGPVVE